MPSGILQTLSAFLPIVARAYAPTLACALDRLADLALAHGRAHYAERLDQRAAQMREAAQ